MQSICWNNFYLKNSKFENEQLKKEGQQPENYHLGHLGHHLEINFSLPIFPTKLTMVGTVLLPVMSLASRNSIIQLRNASRRQYKTLLSSVFLVIKRLIALKNNLLHQALGKILR